MRTKLAKTVKWLLAALVALVLAFVALNAFDQKLDAEAAAFLEPAPGSVPAERNGYFLLAGLSVAEGSAHAAGAKYIDAVLAAEAKRLAGQPAEWPRHPGKTVAMPKLCGLETSCLAQVAGDEAAARRLVEEHRGLLERYRALLAYPEFLETHEGLHYESPIPAIVPLMAAQRVAFADAALALRAGRADAVLDELERSIAFSRRMLAGSRMLVTKMAAATHARKAAQFASELVASPGGALARRASRIGASLAPLSPEERSLERALRAQFRAQAATLRNLDLPAFGTGYFLQRNATLNQDYFAVYKPYLELDAAPAERFDALARPLRERQRMFPAWSLAYNPMGKILSDVSLPELSGYIARMHDLDAALRLVALQAAIAAAGNAPEQLAKLAAEPRYANPYTALPMDWDASRRQLYFQPRHARTMEGGGVPGRFGVSF